ncbi:MAG TPA: YetF domain-containing protein [Acidobacteriota bacterium]|nr:YetF domain-containing protein [Acidobacteriota bacterium]
MQSLADFADALFGLSLSPHELHTRHVAWRTVVVFAFGVLIVRLANRRLLGRNAGFDVLLGVLLGSVLSRAVNGTAPFGPTLFGSALLITFHHLLAAAATRWHRFSRFLKGSPHVLVCNGRVDHDALARCDLSKEDLEEELRLQGHTPDPREIAEARLERTGTLSVVPHPSKE